MCAFNDAVGLKCLFGCVKRILQGKGDVMAHPKTATYMFYLQHTNASYVTVRVTSIACEATV